VINIICIPTAFLHEVVESGILVVEYRNAVECDWNFFFDTKSLSKRGDNLYSVLMLHRTLVEKTQNGKRIDINDIVVPFQGREVDAGLCINTLNLVDKVLSVVLIFQQLDCAFFVEWDPIIHLLVLHLIPPDGIV
jgi:hypothetical protein